jgi:exodeoxyribonuclease VII small subunit
MAKKPDKPELNYQAAREELDSILLHLQQEDLDIEVATKQFERGQELIADLEDYLNQAENRIIELKVQFGANEADKDE